MTTLDSMMNDSRDQLDAIRLSKGDAYANVFQVAVACLTMLKIIDHRGHIIRNNAENIAHGDSLKIIMNISDGICISLITDAVRFAANGAGINDPRLIQEISDYARDFVKSIDTNVKTFSKTVK